MGRYVPPRFSKKWSLQNLFFWLQTGVSRTNFAKNLVKIGNWNLEMQAGKELEKVALELKWGLKRGLEGSISPYHFPMCVSPPPGGLYPQL